MKLIFFAALAGILLLQASGAIPLSSVGGPMMIALVVFAAALALAMHEAWRESRGPLGWLLNLVIALVTTFFAAQVAGLVMVIVLAPFTDGTSLAASGGPVMAIALAGVMAMTLLGVQGALHVVKRWR